ncbi:hypothetical protein Esi_0177_0029 [Ectocarpus siliculosus]|uniref:Uncharacterized protein n=1 Tax=Ectocarpus siliculosus TaxID=2880 RepID=D7FN89_ECTSI|nr:hypothetical protein Esi_0177_0029 [Ectocarpus siliculosus]|eukprot:CBJ30146.1 hypothetical protein Esi_0177_0029 [Ectocarpus siliculosus]
MEQESECSASSAIRSERSSRHFQSVTQEVDEEEEEDAAGEYTSAGATYGIQIGASQG